MSPLIRTLSVRALGRFSLAGLALALSACSTTDRFTGPDLASAPAFSQGAPTETKEDPSGKVQILATALLRTSTIAQPITRSVLVTRREGARLLVPEAGLDVQIPGGAIAADTLTISVTVHAGNSIAYTFEPHGTVFLKSLKFRQDLRNSTWLGAKSRKAMHGGYFQSAAQINPLTGAAVLDELLALRITSHWAMMDLWHFSGYMISMD